MVSADIHKLISIAFTLKATLLTTISVTSAATVLEILDIFLAKSSIAIRCGSNCLISNYLSKRIKG